MKTFFFDIKASNWIYVWSQWFLCIFFDHPIWVVVLKKNYVEVVHFFSQDFRSGTNMFSFVN